MFDFTQEPEPNLGWLARFSTAQRALVLDVASRNVIARADAPQDLCASATFASLAEQYRVPESQQCAVAIAIMRDAVSAALRDGTLKPREHHELERLAEWLGHAGALAAALEAEAAVRYVALVAEALHDGRLSEDEMAILTKAQTDLGLDAKRANTIYFAAANKVLVDAMHDVSGDGLVTDAEVIALQRRAAEFGVETPEMSMHFALSRLAASIREGGELTARSFECLTLQAREEAYMCFPAALSEGKHVTVRTNYAGARTSYTPIKGLTFYGGSVAREPVKEFQRVPIARGMVYLTSKRLVLDGVQKNHAITWRSTIDYQVFSDGLRVGKANGGDLWYQWQPVGIENEPQWHPQFIDAVLQRVTAGKP